MFHHFSRLLLANYCDEILPGLCVLPMFSTSCRLCLPFEDREYGL